jgi:hypothetical protein
LDEQAEGRVPAHEFDPRDHIDRRGEQELFRRLLTYDSDARFLTICDNGGRGKSSLLKRLKYNCAYEIRPAVACCLVELDKVRDPSPFVFARSLIDGFGRRDDRVQQQFAKFNRLDRARVKRDFTPFDDGGGAATAAGPTVRGGNRVQTMLGGTTIGSQSIGQLVEHANEVNYYGPAAEFTDDQEQRVRELCVGAMFDDLRTICAREPMVLLFDGWERCLEPLREWVVDTMLGQYVLHPDRNLRPNKLVVVIAGRPHDPLDTPRGLRDEELRPLFDTAEEFSRTVQSKKSLSEWETDHIRDFFVLSGCHEPTDAQINAVRELLKKGRSLEKIRSLINEHFM